MKKNAIKVLFALSLFSLIVSCDKSNTIEDKESFDFTTQRLLKFKDSFGLKSSVQMPIDSVVWYMEGLLNFEFANNSHLVANISQITDTFFILVDQNSIALTNVEALYDGISLTISNEIPVSMIVDAIDIETSSVLSTQSQEAFLINVTYGPEIQDGKGQYPLVGSEDYWWAAFGAGKCSAYSGQEVGTDAMDVLQYSFNHPTARTIFSYYYTDVAVVHVYLDNAIAEANPWGNYMIWFYSGYDENDCLSPDELNYYISKFPFIRDLYCPSEKNYINAIVCFDMVMNPFGDPNEYSHYYEIRYGIRHLYTPPTN